MLLMIDNYDSFTYNLVQYFLELGEDVKTVRNDELSLNDIDAMAVDKIVISPGPCNPNYAGISLSVIEHYADKLPILGVCLGHQCIGQVFGAKISAAQQIMHGKTSQLQHNGQGVFANLPNPYQVTRYHSLVIDKTTLPDCLEVTSWTEDGEIMGVQHKTHPVYGIQFHPESILSEHGHALLNNFLQLSI